MADPHPWRPDPADTRIPIGAPDTSVQRAARPEPRAHLLVEAVDHLGRCARLSIVGLARLVLGLIHQSLLDVLGQIKQCFFLVHGHSLPTARAAVNWTRTGDMSHA